MTIELNRDAAERALGRDYGSDERRARPWLIGVVALAVIGTFCGIVWYAYTQGLNQGGRGGSLPVLRADPTPARERPAEPGGMKVPYTDKLVYDQVARGGGTNLSPTVERMLPPPETPIARPVAPPVAVAPPPPAAVTPVTPMAPQPAAPQASTAPGASGGSAQPGFAAPQSAPFVRAEPPAARPTPAPQLAQPQPAPQAPTSLRPPVGPQATAVIPPVQPPAPVAAAPATPPAPPPQQAAAPATTPAPAPSAGGAFRIQLAAVRSQEAAQQEWDKMKTAHAPVLGRLSSQIVRVDLGGDRGVFFRIQAGPYGDADAARRACTALKERNVSCLVVRP